MSRLTNRVARLEQRKSVSRAPGWIRRLSDAELAAHIAEDEAAIEAAGGIDAYFEGHPDLAEQYRALLARTK